MGKGIFLEYGGLSSLLPDANTLLLIHGDRIMDWSRYHVPLTNQGVLISTEQNKFGGKSLYFNGNSYMTANVPVSDALTVDFWVYLLPQTQRWAAPFQYHKPGQSITDNNARGVYIHAGMTDSPQWLFRVHDSGNVQREVAVPKMSANEWHHIAVTMSGNGDYRAYFDGKKKAEILGTGVKSLTPLIIGSNFPNSASEYINGFIDEFRVSNVVRWTSDFTPPTMPY